MLHTIRSSHGSHPQSPLRAPATQRQGRPLRTCVLIILAWFLLANVASAANITFLVARTGTISGQTFTANGTLAAEPGTILFDDGSSSQTFINTTGTLSYRPVGGGTRIELSGELRSRHPQGGTVADALVFTTSNNTSYLLVLMNEGTYSATYSGSGSAGQILATLNNYVNAFTADPSTSTIGIVSGAGTVSAITVETNDEVAIVVGVRNAAGNVLEGAFVELFTGTDPGTGIVATGTTDADGSVRFTVTSTTASTVVYRAAATIGGTETILTSTVSVTYESVDTSAVAAESTLSVAPADVVAGGDVTIRVVLRDAQGTVVSGDCERLAISVSGANPGTFGGAAVTEDPDAAGTCIVSYQATVVGTDSIGASLDGASVVGSPALVTVSAGSVSSVASSIGVAPANPVAGDEVVVSVVLRDAFGNALTGVCADVVVEVSGANPGTFGGAAVIEDPADSGTCVVRYAADAAGEDDVIVSFDGAPLADPVRIQVAGADERVPAADAVEVSAPDGQAGVPTTVRIAVMATDGSPLPGAADQLLIEVEGSNVGAEVSTIEDHGDGTYTVTYVPFIAGQDIIVVTLGGVHVASATSNVMAGPASAITVVMTAAPASLTANGVDTSTITVTLSDAFGNALGRGGDSVALSTTRGTLGTVVDGGDGTYTAVLTASTQSGDADLTVTVNGVAADAQLVVTMEPELDEQAIRDAFGEVTGAFLSRRADLLLSSEPRLYRLDAGRTTGFELTATQGFGSLSGSVSAAGGDDVEDTVRIDVRPGDAAGSALFSARQALADGAGSLWFDGSISSYRDTGGGFGLREGTFGVGYVGADLRLTESTAVGVILQMDWARERVDAYASIDGVGWMVGPYVAAELTPGLFFSARAAVGTSMNDATIDVFDDGTDRTARFTTLRGLARAALYGTYVAGDWRLTPTVEAAYMFERQRAYEVGDTISTVDVEGATIALGRTSVSGLAEYAFDLGAHRGTLFVLPKLDWDVLRVGADANGGRWKGAVEYGARGDLSDTLFGELTLRNDGIGHADYGSWNVRFSLRSAF